MVLSGTNLLVDRSAAKKRKRKHVDASDPATEERKRQEKVCDSLSCKVLQIAQLRRANRIFTWGDAVTEPFIEFVDLKIDSRILANLEKFKIQEPTPIQMQVSVLFFPFKTKL